MSLIAFRSLDDGTIAGADKGLAVGARRAAPDLAASTEHSDALSAYVAYGMYISSWGDPNAPQWARVDRATASGIFKPGANLLLIDCCWEGEDFDANAFTVIHRELAQRRIPLDTVGAVTMCRKLPDLYQAWANDQGLGARLRLYSYWGNIPPVGPHLESIYQGENSFQVRLDEIADRLYGAKLPAHRFLCLNYMDKPWRLSLAMQLRESFPETSLVSYGRIADDEITQHANVLHRWMGDSGRALERRVHAFAAQTPLILDIENRNTAARNRAAYGVDPELYWRTSLSVVTESEMSSKGQCRVTEKAVKPLGLFHPVILAGNKGALQALRDEGFRTFQPFIDESYDDIADGPERLQAVQRELSRLGMMSDQEFAQALRSIAEVVLHNACQLRYMRPHVERLHIVDILQRLRRDFGPRLGYGEPLPVKAPQDDHWDTITPVMVDEIMEIKFDATMNRLALVPRGQFDPALSIFTHTTVAGAPVIPQSHYWPMGAKRLVIELPKGAIKQVVVGQFVREESGFHNVWRVTVGPEAPQSPDQSGTGRSPRQRDVA